MIFLGQDVEGFQRKVTQCHALRATACISSCSRSIAQGYFLFVFTEVLKNMNNIFLLDFLFLFSQLYIQVIQYIITTSNLTLFSTFQQVLDSMLTWKVQWCTSRLSWGNFNSHVKSYTFGFSCRSVYSSFSHNFQCIQN